MLDENRNDSIEKRLRTIDVGTSSTASNVQYASI